MRAPPGALAAATRGEPHENKHWMPDNNHTARLPLDECPLGAPASAGAGSGSDQRDKGWLVRATLLLALVYFGLICTNAWLIWAARGNTIAQANLANTNLARAVTQRFEATLAVAEHIVDSVVYALERDEMTPERLQRLQPVLVQHVTGSAHLKGLFVYDAKGYWVATSEAGWSNLSNNADRDYFIHHRDNPSGRPLLGAPIVSRSSKEWVVPVSRRINDANGQFAGVVLATISVKHLLAMLEQFDIGAQGAITVTLNSRILVRRPFVESEIGLQTTWPAAQTYPNTRTLDAPSTIDGVQRLISFENLLNHAVRVSVASSKQEVLDHWVVASSLQTVWVVFLGVLLGLAARYTRRSIQHRLAAERGLLETRDALSDANQRLAELAHNDGLTGLANRRTFDQRLERCLRSSQREQRAMAVVMVDVDEFKKYNDRYGHVAGDACLKRVAAALRTSAQRPDDLVARYGGEEMVMLLPSTDLDGAQAIAEKARASVAEMRIAHDASAAGIVTVSLGVAAWVPDAEWADPEVIQAADAALYQAKHAGRNRVGVATLVREREAQETLA
jgi:diguanylate cyclase (GGDEF)-like protein